MPNAQPYSDAQQLQQDLAVAQGQLRGYEGWIRKEFAHSAYLSELTDLRDQLKAGLSDKAPEWMGWESF